MVWKQVCPRFMDVNVLVWAAEFILLGLNSEIDLTAYYTAHIFALREDTNPVSDEQQIDNFSTSIFIDLHKSKFLTSHSSIPVSFVDVPQLPITMVIGSLELQIKLSVGDSLDATRISLV